MLFLSVQTPPSLMQCPSIGRLTGLLSSSRVKTFTLVTLVPLPKKILMVLHGIFLPVLPIRRDTLERVSAGYTSTNYFQWIVWIGEEIRRRYSRVNHGTSRRRNVICQWCIVIEGSLRGSRARQRSHDHHRGFVLHARDNFRLLIRANRQATNRLMVADKKE